MEKNTDKLGNEAEPGDLIKICGPNSHWAVYVGNGFVVHFGAPKSPSASSSGAVDGIVKKEKLLDVAGEYSWRVNNSLDKKYKPFSPDEIVKKACSLFGASLKYDLTEYNSEHFATEMRYGKAESRRDVIEAKPGDLIEYIHGNFNSWAVYVGNGYVVHFGAPNSSLASRIDGIAGIVKKEKLQDVVGKDSWKVSNSLDEKYRPLPPDKIVKKACSLVGASLKYDLTEYNSEHFATEMRYGKAESRRVQEVAVAALLIGVAVVVGALFISGKNN